ncbi:MAG: hypothetical protein RR636_14510, partial [Clostridium sp.]
MSDGGTGVDTSGIEKAMTNNWEDSFLKITGIAKAGLKTFAKSIIDVGIELSGLGDEIETILLPVTESIVQAFDELGSKLKEALGSEEMKAHIQNIADGIGKLIEIVAELISEWIPKIIEGLSWIVDNGEEILTIITSVTVAIYAFKAGAIITSVVESWKKAKEAIASYEVASKGAKLSQGIMNGVFSVWEIIVSLMTGKITLAAAATGLWSKAVAALNKAWKNNPMGIVLVAIVAVVGAIVYLWNTNEGFRTAIIDCWNAILNAGKVVWEWLVKFFTEDIPNAWNSMLEWFSSVGEWFASLWITIKQAFVDGWNSIVFFFTESIPAWWESVKLSFVTGWQAITNFFTETIPALIEAIFIWFSELPYKIGYALGYVIATVIKWGIDTWASFSEACINIYNTVIEWFSQLPIKIGEFISTAYNNIVEWGTNIWNKFIEICTNVYNSVTEWFS